MFRLQLYFTSGRSPELVETSFVRDSVQTRAVRGRTSEVGSPGGTFLWSPAVRALALLAVKSAEERDARLVGSSGSAASSLDFALNKDPAWLSDMFGCDSSGRPYAHRLIRRINPGRKRAGDVSLQFDTSRVELEIFVERQQVREASALRRLSETIECAWNQRSEVFPAAAQSSTLSATKLKEILHGEMCRRLSDRSFSHERLVRAHLQRVRTSASVQRVAGKKAHEFDLPQVAYSPSAMLGVYDSTLLQTLLDRRGGLRVSLPLIGLFPAFGMFRYLTQNKGFRFQLDWRYQHAVELVSQMLRGNFVEAPELCVLGEAPSATLLGSSLGNEYFPLCFLPSNEVQLIRKRGLKGARMPRRIAMLMDEPSNASFYYESLQSTQVLSKDVELIHSEPLQTQSLLDSDAELGAILFNPFADLHTKIFNGQTTEPSEFESGNMACFLWAHRSLLEEPALLSLIVASINDAWIRLGSDSSLRGQSVDSIFDDGELLTALSRYTGMVPTAETPV